MAINILSAASAYNPGHELWILPDYKNSNWTPKIDWLMNFQILRSKTHVMSELNLSFIESLENLNLKIKKRSLDFITDPIVSKNGEHNFPIIIPTHKYFPNKWVIIIPFLNQNTELWSSQIIHTWSNLKRPNLRIFTPTNLKSSSVYEQISKFIDNVECSIVEDSP